MDFENDEHKKTVSRAFSNQSVVFDKIYTENRLSEYMRQKFREELLRQLTPGAQILELNCGTGMDTLFLAGQGYQILATDNADGMLAQLNGKVEQQGLQQKISMEKCDFEHLASLQPRKFNHIYSNFSGLNCTSRLDKVLLQMKPLLQPGGKVSLVIMPKICPWELVMVLKGKFRTAFRRLGSNGARAHIEHVYFRTWYYNPSYVLRVMKQDYRLLSLKGICITVPPPFMEHFTERYPGLFSFLRKADRKLEDRFPFNRCCDQYMITLQLK